MGGIFKKHTPWEVGTPNNELHLGTIWIWIQYILLLLGSTNKQRLVIFKTSLSDRWLHYYWL